MRSGKIADGKLLKLIDIKGMNQSEAARELGVTRQAVSRRLQQLRGKTTKVIATKKIEEVIDRKLDLISQLEKINAEANRLLDELEDSPGLKIRVMAEIRGQLELQLKILQTVYSLQEAQSFQETVLKVIGEVEPSVRKAIIDKLNQQRAVRSAVKYA